MAKHAVGALQVYVRLSERLGLSDHLMVLNVMLSKIATNLKVYGSCDEVITLTLNLFQVGDPLYLLLFVILQLGNTPGNSQVSLMCM